jgi:hypothetical protein
VTGPTSPEIARARALTAEFMAGGPRSFDAFRDLAQLLLQATVLATGQAVRLSGRGGRRGDDVRVLAGVSGPTDPLRLRDGRWLRLAVTLYLDRQQGNRLKVRKSSFQYQADRDGDHPIFRYDYLRIPGSTEPPAHLNIYGTLTVTDLLPGTRPLSRVHFPTSRVAMEAGIRLLADDFAVPTATDPTAWRPLLAASETAFYQIAHQPRQ